MCGCTIGCRVLYVSQPNVKLSRCFVFRTPILSMNDEVFGSGTWVKGFRWSCVQRVSQARFGKDLKRRAGAY